MRLLIITQTIDTEDHFLSFFPRWVEELAKRFQSVVVICLYKGTYDLPGNVPVLSLGKEKWRSKAKYIFLLFYFSLRYANRYDAVFVHMNEEYVVLAGWLWRLMGKKVFMWRNHHSGNRMTDVASIFCNKVLCTSKYSYTAKYKKTMLMPVGMDLEMFKPDPGVKRIPRSVLSFGRISQTKNVDVFIEALQIVKGHGVELSADIFGDAPPGSDPYLEALKSRAHELGLDDVLRFYSGVPHADSPEVFMSHDIFVNLASSGMYDKMIFEAMACGCLTLASNDNLKGNIDERLVINERTPAEVASRIMAALSLPVDEKRRLVQEEQAFAETNSLSKLADALYHVIHG